MDRYSVENGDHLEGKFDTLEDAIACALGVGDDLLEVYGRLPRPLHIKLGAMPQAAVRYEDGTGLYVDFIHRDGVGS